MDLIKCPRCGEEYSSSYPVCPFCEEDGDEPRKIRITRTTRRIADRKKAQSARGGLIVVLILVLALLSWYLFGDRILRGDQSPDEPTPDQQEQANGPDVPAINSDDPFYEPPDDAQAGPGGESDTTGEPTAEPPDDEPDVIDENVDVSNAKLSRSDFTLSGSSDSWQLKVSGTEATPRWSVDNANVATVDADGWVSAVANGTTTVHAKVGTRTLDCIVRVINTGKTAAPAEAPTTADPAPGADAPSTDAAAPNTAAVDTSSLSVKTNYGTVLQKDPGTGYPDCTVRIGGDPIQLIVVGTNAAVTWKSNDNSIVKVDAEGNLTPVTSGNATVVATVGSASVTCIIRVR